MTSATYKNLYEDKKPPKRKGTCCCTRLPWYGKAGLGAIGLIVVGIVTTVIVFRSRGPLHASCKVTW